MALRHKLRASDAVARAAAAEVGDERAARARDDDAARTPLGDANARRREEKPTQGGAEAEAPPRGATPMASDAKRKKSKKEKETAAPPSAKAERASPRLSPRLSPRSAVTAAATKDATPPKPAASPAAPHSAPIAGLSPVAAAPGKSPVRSSPRLRAAALAAETAAAPKTSPGATASVDFQFAAVGASARRAPARGAATKTPSRLGKASKDAAAREATATATATSLGARVSTDDASRETRAGARRKARDDEKRNGDGDGDRKALPTTTTHVSTQQDQNSRESPSGKVGLTLGLRPRRGGLTIGGARRVLVETNDAYDAATLAEDVPTFAGPDPNPDPDLDDTLVDRAEPRVTVPDVRSTGKSSVKSSRNPGPYPRDELVSAERKITSEERGDFSLSAAGRSSRAQSAPRRAPRPPPPKDLTVPVSPAITKARKGSKRKNDRSSEDKTSEELDLERSLAAAAKEKAKRRRVEDRAGDAARAAGSTRVVATGVGRSTRATAKKKTQTRAAARVAFGGRVVAETAKKEENGPGSASAPRPRRVPTVPTVPRWPDLRGASLRDRFGKTSAKTSEALELERLTAVPRFKARPLKRGVLQGSAGAAEKAAAAAAKRREAAAEAARVKPAPFDAAVGRARTRDERAAERAELAARDAKRARAAADAEPFGFAGAVPPTAPESPAFATARRAALRAPHEPHPFSSLAVGPAAATRGARRVAASDVDAPLSSSTNVVSDAFGRVDGVTCPAPFALATDRRGEAARAELEFRLERKARLEAERARAAAAARPVPKTSSSRRRSRLPEPVFKPPTVTEPFRLRGEALSAYEKQREEKALRKEKEEETRRRRFVAAPLPESTFRASFVARKSDAPLTMPAEDVLAAGARRAAERAAFDAEMRIRERRQEEAKEETRRLEEKEEAKARAAFRRSARFEAAPMPDYDALASLGVAPVAERALTRPESPPLRTNRRASRWG